MSTSASGMAVNAEKKDEVEIKGDRVFVRFEQSQQVCWCLPFVQCLMASRTCLQPVHDKVFCSLCDYPIKVSPCNPSASSAHDLTLALFLARSQGIRFCCGSCEKDGGNPFSFHQKQDKVGFPAKALVLCFCAVARPHVLTRWSLCVCVIVCPMQAVNLCEACEKNNADTGRHDRSHIFVQLRR